MKFDIFVFTPLLNLLYQQGRRNYQSRLCTAPNLPDDGQINMMASAFNQEKDTWVAGYNTFFEGKTYRDAKALLGTNFPDEEELATLLSTAKPQAHYDAVKDVPEAFDSRDKWGSLIQPIRDQQQCGSCWAFSAAEVLSDRFSIATNKSVVLSPEDLVSCDKGNLGCQGGMLPAAWKYLTATGAVTDTCFPYAAGTGHAPACASTCADSEDFASAKHKSTGGYAVKSVANMQKEIMANGPIQVAFNVYKSFMSYKSGVYKKKTFELIPEGGHAGMWPHHCNPLLCSPRWLVWCTFHSLRVCCVQSRSSAGEPTPTRAITGRSPIRGTPIGATPASSRSCVVRTSAGSRSAARHTLESPHSRCQRALASRPHRHRSRHSRVGSRMQIPLQSTHTTFRLVRALRGSGSLTLRYTSRSNTRVYNKDTVLVFGETE